MVEESTNILLGTSGWSYREWVGPFYQRKEKRKLKAYSRVFKTAEIDSTFYAFPTKGTVMGWAKYSPDEFVYTAKLPKLITHEKMLSLGEGIEEDLNRFCELLRPVLLNGKLGCLLIQLPPKYEFDPEGLEKFFQILPAEFKFAVEFRHLSWMRKETWKLLKKYGVAYTIVDEPLLPPELRVTSDFAYFRWHGHGARPWFNYRYKVEELKPWVPRVSKVSKMVNKVYGYFNNHFHGYAVENCLQVLEMLGTLTTEQAKAKTIAEKYFRISAKMREPTLEAFIPPKRTTFEKLFKVFIDKPRLKRAVSIKDNEVTVKEVTDNRVEASIREYHIVIDLKKRLVLHDCADWNKVSPSKRFCKHLGKLLLSIDKEKALDILRQIYTTKEAWEFKLYKE